ncbi:Hypothetical predicted protein [Mytilus galloprovincialis]|uniref:Uncharacterized protein n=1 Tax=Mytilus galloprovincialis TaxID=29158 RepID=A0A8B6GIR1_MYTGA|nr:Hypothetical predicted protein [Mytilus galloprovincialis]
MPPKQKSSAVQVNKNDKQLAPQVTKIEVKKKPKAGHEELKSLPFLQLTYDKLIQIHDSGAPTSKPQKDPLILEHQIDSELTWIAEQIRSYRQTSGSILEIKELLKDRLKSEKEVSKGPKPNQSMQTDPKTKSIDLTVDDNIREIKTEISQIINELSILEKDMQSLLSLAQKGDLESKTEKGKNNKKETQLQGKVTAHQAFEKIQTILHGQMKKTGSATNKKQALDAVNEK